MTQRTGELFDLGYQHYDGPREGRMRARKAVFFDGFRTTLGLGRGAGAKVLPMLLFGAAMAPAITVAGQVPNDVRPHESRTAGHECHHGSPPEYHPVCPDAMLLICALSFVLRM